MQSDVQIAQAAHIQHINHIAEKIGISPEKLEHYGKYKAKINPADAYRLPEKRGKIILVKLQIHQFRILRHIESSDIIGGAI